MHMNMYALISTDIPVCVWKGCTFNTAWKHPHLHTQVYHL